MITYGENDLYTDRYGATGDLVDLYRERLSGGHTSYMQELLGGHDSYIESVLDGDSNDYSAATETVHLYTDAGGDAYGGGGLTVIQVIYQGMYDPEY
ncbi:hypothetical protein [Halorarum salinum]|uniref:Uncharacterized protein n=1 Tax=Halorarum salinum TaxID=2743089 RepID=A0A7D5QDE8_9EURY|nr:hypothetical protein [Halobaculum salinum]QLG62041.1 hypothetical protein HUG12_10010 [Halobaculum salinum]